MPRAAQAKPPVPERLGDRVAAGALTSVFPPGLVDRVVAECGWTEQRRRLLPARMVVYYVLALALFADVAYLEVLRLLVEALRRPGRRRHADPLGLPRLPVKSALVQARARLGPEPLQGHRPCLSPERAILFRSSMVIPRAKWSKCPSVTPRVTRESPATPPGFTLDRFVGVGSEGSVELGPSP